MDKPARWNGAALCAGWLGCAGCAVAGPEITWYLYDLAPLVIADGPHKGAGFMELALHQQWIPALPEYKHHIVVVPIQRIAMMLKSDPQACNPGLIRNAEREQFMVFSSPTLAALPAGMFVRRNDMARIAPYVNAKGKIVLDKPGTRDALAAHYATWLDDDARKLADALRRNAFAAKP